MHSSSGPEVPVPIYQAGVKPSEVAGFESQRYLAFIVSDLNQGNNLQIAENLAPVVIDLLDSLNG
jgi:hypothetical protein